MKRLVIIAMISLLTLSVWAVPARRYQTTVTQPDGTILKLMLVGDEHLHCLVTDEGVPVQLDSISGFYLPVDTMSLRESMDRAKVRRALANQRRAARLSGRSSAMAVTDTDDIGVRQSIKGNKKGLVILVNFKDKKMKYTKADFSDQFNTKGYNKNNHIGSVRDYFYDQSYGNLEIDFDVVGPVTVSNNYAYYGKNDKDGNDVAPAEMVAEACQLVDDVVDFSKYDWDGDGWVDQVYVIYAGYGESSGASSSTIWPHEYDLYSANYYGDGPGYQLLDGVYVNTYACSYELEGTSGSEMCVIGSACHEFSHCLGLPDTYDTDYATNGVTTTMFDWSLMDGGSYNGPNGKGAVPAGLTAYERWCAGWVELSELSDPCYVTDLPNLGDSPRAYVIYNDNCRNEAYLLENRQNKDWFAYPDGAHGLLIYHIDYNKLSWENNSLNAYSSHPRCAIVPASGIFGTKGAKMYSPTTAQLRGHTWPGSSNNTALTDNSKPSATLFNKAKDGRYYLGKPIEDITETNGKISFVFNGGIKLEKPQFTCDFTVNSGKVNLSWTSVEGATHYELKIIESSAVSQPATLLEESMEKFVSSSVGSINLEKNLDKYMNNTGWTGSNVYQGSNGAKLGSSSVPGSLISPALNVEGTVTVTVTISKYSEKVKATGFLKLSSSSASITTDNLLSSCAFSVSDDSQTFELKNATNPCYLHILPSQRAYVRDIKIVAGAVGSSNESVIGNIQKTNYEFDAKEGMSYTFSVRALAEPAKSDWSEEGRCMFETAIEQLHTPTFDSETCYDLMGRRVNKDRQGLIVRHGKLAITKY